MKMTNYLIDGEGNTHYAPEGVIVPSRTTALPVSFEAIQFLFAALSGHNPMRDLSYISPHHILKIQAIYIVKTLRLDVPLDLEALQPVTILDTGDEQTDIACFVSVHDNIESIEDYDYDNLSKNYIDNVSYDLYLQIFEMLKILPVADLTGVKTKVVGDEEALETERTGTYLMENYVYDLVTSPGVSLRDRDGQYHPINRYLLAFSSEFAAATMTSDLTVHWIFPLNLSAHEVTILIHLTYCDYKGLEFYNIASNDRRSTATALIVALDSLGIVGGDNHQAKIFRKEYQ